MRKKRTLCVLGFFFIFSVMSLFGVDTNTSSPKINMTPELKKEFPIKAHHEKLSLSCTDCHEGQGDDPKDLKLIGDKGCLSCHKTKQFLADRLKFMDALHTNPHNSIHDGPKLYCDECHNEHKPSENMCLSCHSNDVKIWMRPTP
ncbi:cytochrome c3 family protein [Sulfurospirillum diekertiae]|uniref:Cytochrome c3 family protein n=1 Tax=Sulfurospirillum diekertiae TaxID=1854492 RepID=A0A290HVG1_9BACT|nr:cytochrome c3 family protein [Sulfurospirillum diekertiae]ATB69349.1 tetrahem cytochrome C [Sulfurospirillum diekertiae]QIR76993.1 cytochrome c3 family protein [Sulfurospirillum diekertiae]QIR79608.1 cytochrome c3 family protein [Sulfurospirillum diekertiae]